MPNLPLYASARLSTNSLSVLESAYFVNLFYELSEQLLNVTLRDFTCVTLHEA